MPVLIAVRSGFGLLWFVPYAAVGTLLIIRRPGLSIGWLLLAIGWVLIAQVMPVDATAEQFAAGTVPWPQLVLSCIAGGSLGSVRSSSSPTLPWSSRRDTCPGGTWGRIARISLTAVSLLLVCGAVGPTINVNLIDAPNGVDVTNPLAIAPDAGIWQVLNPSLGFVIVISLLIGGVASVLIRHRRARGVEREQSCRGSSPRWPSSASPSSVGSS